MKELQISKSWKDVFNEDHPAYTQLESEILPEYLHQMRWFGAKSSNIKRYSIDHKELYPLSDKETAYLLFVEIVFQTSNTETYLLPVTLSKELEEGSVPICLVKYEAGTERGYLVDAIYTAKFRNSIFKNITNSNKLKLNSGQLIFSKGKILKGVKQNRVKSEVLKLEQSNSTILYDDNYFLKVYRKIFRDNNPDLELTRFLSERVGFEYSPNFAGSIEWVRSEHYKVSIGLMQEKVENRGEAWNDTLDEITEFFRRVEELSLTIDDLPKLELYKPLSLEKVPDFYKKLVGESMLQKVQKLAVRTAQMHIALFSDKSDRYFSPENFTSDYKVWLFNRIMYMLDYRFSIVEQNIDKLKGVSKEYAEVFLESKDIIKDRILNFDELRLNSCRIRIHGDYHLGQILLTGDDFCILDFEGEPESTIRDRKVKQSPIKDLAGLFRSYHYAVFATVFQRLNSDLPVDFLTEVGGRYYRLIVGLILHFYTETTMAVNLNIGYSNEIEFLLRYHLFEKAIYELGYELHARPEWVVIPLKGLMQILNNE
jgi:maltose alpha-D-glucosyltransferase/alpha-amylase